MTDSKPTTPTFRVHRSGPVLLRGAILAALCAALTAGFIAQTFASPAAAAPEASAVVCVDAPGTVCC